MGYAGDLIVGVWVGNDDNSPLNGVTGGALPARIWRDFMSVALALPTPKPSAAPDPEGPVQPFDIEEGTEIPLDENGSAIRFEDESVILNTEVEGMPLELRLDENGLAVEPREPREPPR